MMTIAIEGSSSPYWLTDTTTGIHSEDDALTEGEEEELHFHIELGEAPLASPIVAAIEAYISDTKNNLESSLSGWGAPRPKV